jgi:hypothetical protein
MVLIAVGIAGLLSVRLMYMYENRRRAKLRATWDETDYVDEANSTTRRGDQRYTFVFGY